MPVGGPGMLFPTITAIARVFCPLMIFSVKLQPPRMTSAIDPAGTVNGWQPSSIVPIAPGLTGAVLPSLTSTTWPVWRPVVPRLGPKPAIGPK